MTDIFSKGARVHFVGIKGIAMAALAVWAKEKGMIVTGSDVPEEFPSDPVLAKAGIRVFSGFDTAHVGTDPIPNLVIYTGAHGGRDNPEVIAAHKRSIPTLPHGIALGEVMDGSRQISVAGSHGKTTTSAMIASVLAEAGLDPSWAIGCGEIRGLGPPGHFGRGDFFVAEADEYITDPTHDKTPRFLWQKPEVLVVTNIDFDHPDAYLTIADVQHAFALLQRKLVGKRVTVINADDQVSAPLLLGGGDVRTYGKEADAQCRITDIAFAPERTTFTLASGGKKVLECTLRVPGVHNAYNAAAAAIACEAMGVSWADIGRGLARFGGTKRRFEKVGQWRGMHIFDDYAHHPKEIRATLAAARAWFGDRHIYAVFQPHTYSRTKALFHDFVDAFGDASTVIITDIYASAREHETLGISGQMLAESIARTHADAHYLPDYEQVREYLTAHADDGGVVVFIGAGDIYGWSHAFIKQ